MPRPIPIGTIPSRLDLSTNGTRQVWEGRDAVPSHGASFDEAHATVRAELDRTQKYLNDSEASSGSPQYLTAHAPLAPWKPGEPIIIPNHHMFNMDQQPLGSSAKRVWDRSQQVSGGGNNAIKGDRDLFDPALGGDRKDQGRRRPRDEAELTSDDSERQKKARKITGNPHSDQDENEFRWTADATIANAALTGNHLLVMQQIKIYQKDLDKALQSLYNSACNPYFPEHLWKAILEDKAVNFDDIYADTHPKTSKGHDASSWLVTWEMYARAVEFAFPMRQLELRNYGEHIRGLFSRTTQSAHRNILGYDIAVRKLIGSQRGLLFDDYREEQVTNLYQSYLDVNGGQYVKEATADASASGGNGLGGRRSDKKSREICRNFNFGACLGRCDRLHVCNLCRGPHTAKSDECIGNTPAGKKNTVNR